jgi:hypothetical protein
LKGRNNTTKLVLNAVSTQRKSNQFSQLEKNQLSNNNNSRTRFDANTQRRDNINNHHQVYQSSNHIDRSPAVTNNVSLTNCGSSNKENLPPNSSEDDQCLEKLLKKFQEEKARLQRREDLLLSIELEQHVALCQQNINKRLAELQRREDSTRQVEQQVALCQQKINEQQRRESLLEQRSAELQRREDSIQQQVTALQQQKNAFEQERISFQQQVGSSQQDWIALQERENALQEQESQLQQG